MIRSQLLSLPELLTYIKYCIVKIPYRNQSRTIPIIAGPVISGGTVGIDTEVDAMCRLQAGGRTVAKGEKNWHTLYSIPR